MTKENQISRSQPLLTGFISSGDQKVMLDSDLAEIYGVETRFLIRRLKEKS